jgi:hypothetical protein
MNSQKAYDTEPMLSSGSRAYSLPALPLASVNPIMPEPEAEASIGW